MYRWQDATFSGAVLQLIFLSQVSTSFLIKIGIFQQLKTYVRFLLNLLKFEQFVTHSVHVIQQMGVGNTKRIYTHPNDAGNVADLNTTDVFLQR